MPLAKYTLLDHVNDRQSSPPFIVYAHYSAHEAAVAVKEYRFAKEKLAQGGKDIMVYLHA